MKQSPLDRYINVLENIAGMPSCRLSELADSCRMPLSSTHRVLKTLIDSGLVVSQDRGRKGYVLGPRLMRLVHTGSEDAWIKIVGQKCLDELAEGMGETCYMTKLIGREVISVAWATPLDGLKAYVVPGLSQPLHAAASSKAILAFQFPALVKKLLIEPLPKLCTETKTTLAEIFNELAEVRRRGYATCVNENEAGIAAIACPIHLASGEVIHALGVTGVADRFPRIRIEECARTLACAAASLSRRIRESTEQTVAR